MPDGAEATSGGEDPNIKERRTSNGSKPSSPNPEAKDPSSPAPPDGGWGWIVVLSSFMISVFVDGVCFSIGIFFTPFLDYFGSSKAQTAWVGSVLNGTYLSIGPVVGAFVNRYGCLKTAMVGSVIASASFFISTFSSNISVLIVTYGFLGGIGFGFAYLPAIVMVGYYFEKRRALATGIACCGSGIGAFVFAPLCNYLLETYGWKGATWILSGVVLHGLVFSFFYRPLKTGESLQIVENAQSSPDQTQALLENDTENDDNDEGEKKQFTHPDPPLLASKDREPAPRNIPSSSVCANEDHNGLPQTSNAQGDELFLPRVVISEICFEMARPVKNADEEVLDQGIPTDKNDNETVQRSDKTQGGSGSEKNELEAKCVKLWEGKRSGCKPERPVSELFYPICPKIHQLQCCEIKPNMSDSRLKDSVNPIARMAYSQDGLPLVTVKKRRHQHHHYHHLDVGSPLLRKDIFYSGSLRHIAEFRDSDTMADYRRKVMNMEEVEGGEEAGGWEEKEGETVVNKRKSCFKRLVCDALRRVFDVNLLKSPTFVIYGFSCFICMLGFFVPFIYLPTLSIDLGMGTAKAAFLISIIGIANTIGRVLVGFISDQPWADCLLINNVALVVGGVSTCCVPFFSVYPVFAAYTFVFGTCIAVFVSLRSIIMVELMGLQKLTNAFGLVIMCQGVSTFIGAPIAGMLSDLTGDYNISFYVAGTFMALGGVICFPLRRIASWEKDLEQRNKGDHEQDLLQDQTKTD